MTNGSESECATHYTTAPHIMNDTVLPTCTAERDLRLLIQENLKVSDQCMTAANTANRIMGMNNRTFSFKSKALINSQYKSLVRSQNLRLLCTCTPRSYLRFIDLLEKVQRSDSRMVQDLV